MAEKDRETTEKINQYYIYIITKPNFIKVNNSYERYCVYEALKIYASDFNSVWFHKQYEKRIRFAKNNTCKYCFRKKNDSENIIEWETNGWECYFGGDYFYKCNTCGNNNAKIWEKGDKMFMEKIPCQINIFYSPSKKTKKMRFFEKHYC